MGPCRAFPRVKPSSPFSSRFGYDPLPTITALRIPVLWIYGGQDRFTPTQLDMARLAALDKSNFTVQLYPKMNHDMVETDTGTFRPLSRQGRV